MSTTAIAVTGVRATLDEGALAARRIRLSIERGVLRVSQVGIAAVLPVTLPLQVERISGGRIYFRTFFTSVGGVAEVLPRTTLEGRLRLEITSFRAGGLLPIPIQAVVWAIRNFLPTRRGIYFGEGDQLEADLGELLEPYDITLGPLRKVSAGEGMVELQF